MTPNKTPSRPKHVNQGIQATNVHAKALAVGPNALAINTHGIKVPRHANFKPLITEFISVLDQCDMPPELRKKVNLDLTHLRQLTTDVAIDRRDADGCFRRLRSKLSKIGNVAEQVALSELVKKMTNLIEINPS